MASRPCRLLNGVLVASALMCSALVSSAEPQVHHVQAGDSLWSIARDNGISVKTLRELNGLDPAARLRVGTRLKLPAPVDPPPPARGGTAAPAWVLEKPPAEAQVSKNDVARNGVNPCLTPDPGTGAYGDWSSAISVGKLLLPRGRSVDEQGQFDVLVHFHGREPIRKEWVKVMDHAVLVAVDLGIGSGSYSKAFEDPTLFRGLVASVEREVAKANGVAVARARQIGISAWSAGYGAVTRILSQSYGKAAVDSVVLLDGLHSGYWPESLNEHQLGPFEQFAKLAAAGDRFMFVSHSSIVPRGYASTTETANFLIWKVGGRPAPFTSRAIDPMGLERITSFSRGAFHVRGFRGSSTKDHCAHLGLMRDVLSVHLAPRWSTAADSEVTSARSPASVPDRPL